MMLHPHLASVVSAGFAKRLAGKHLYGSGVSPVPILDKLSSYGQDVGSGDLVLTAHGTFASGDQIVLWNQALTTTFVDSSTLTATVPAAKFATANFGTVCVERTGAGRSYCLPFEATPVQAATSNYLVGMTSALVPNYGAGGVGSPPAKGSSVAHALTGAVIKRMTDPADAGWANMRNIYSKWSSVNATGEYLMVEKEDSQTTAIYRLSDGAYIGQVQAPSGPGGSTGESWEPRWSTRGDEPYTLYYLSLDQRKLYKRDVINLTPEVLVKDFTAVRTFASDQYLMNDSEGTSSIDMRFWGFMVRSSTPGQSNLCYELMVYDAFADAVVRASPSGGAGVIALGTTATTATAGGWSIRPNWVSMSPRGDRFQMGWGRAYTGCGYEDYYGTIYDAPHTCSAVDFSDHRQCAVDQTHGAWCWTVSADGSMKQGWVCQNNRTDHMEVQLDIASFGQAGSFRTIGSTIDAQTATDADPATNGRQYIVALGTNWNGGDWGYGDPGQHYMYQMSGRKAGFFFVGTDGKYNANAYGYNSLLCFRISDQRCWRVASLPHQHLTPDMYWDQANPQGDYFTEVQWAQDPFGLTLHGSLNWEDGTYNGSTRAQDNVYIVQLDSGWANNAIWA
jgi:hypothetical protein